MRAYLSSARPNEAILFERRERGKVHIVSAIVDRRSGALSLIGEAANLDQVEAEHLRSVARGPTKAPPLAPIDLTVARARLARALMATRIAGGDVPSWVAQRAELVGDPAHPDLHVDDVYLCIACDRPLPVHEQLARAESRGLGDGPPRCPHCRGDSHAPDSEGEAWLGRAWLMIAAGLPRRALVCAARAEGLRLAGKRLDAVRGAAYLALGDRMIASPYLERAIANEPEGARKERFKGWLVE